MFSARVLSWQVWFLSILIPSWRSGHDATVNLDAYRMKFVLSLIFILYADLIMIFHWGTFWHFTNVMMMSWLTSNLFLIVDIWTFIRRTRQMSSYFSWSATSILTKENNHVDAAVSRYRNLSVRVTLFSTVNWIFDRRDVLARRCHSRGLKTCIVSYECFDNRLQRQKGRLKFKWSDDEIKLQGCADSDWIISCHVRFLVYG